MKQTLIYKMDKTAPDTAALRRCAEIIRRGGLVVFPTETVYGIACRGDNEAAIKSLFEAKERPLDKPLLAHLYDTAQAEEIAYLTQKERRMIKRHAPGPLTVIARKKPCVPDIMTSGGDTVGLRFPSDPVGLMFMRECGCMLAATSANISGDEAGVTGEQAAKELFGRVDAIIDTGRSQLGVPSTIVSLSDGGRILREGAISGETIMRELAEPVIIGVCGRSGSGKSALCAALSDKGYTVVDADAVYHSLIADGNSDCTAAICREFGKDILKGSVIDRARLREKVFRDEKALQKLNTITHAFVIDEMDNIASSHAGEDVIFADVPLLFESGYDKKCDATVCVWASDDECIGRICERDRITAEAARERLSKQGDFRQRCDLVIENKNGSSPTVAAEKLLGSLKSGGIL